MTLDPRKIGTRTAHSHRPDVVVIQFSRSEFGSAEELSLANLADQLRSTARKNRAHRLIVDLGSIRYLGAGFLGVLSRFAVDLRTAGRQLIICGGWCHPQM